MNPYDRLLPALDGLGELDGFFSSVWKEVRRVGKKIEKPIRQAVKDVNNFAKEVRRKTIPKVIRKAFDKLVRSPIFQGIINVVASAFGLGMVTMVAFAALQAYDQNVMKELAKKGGKLTPKQLAEIHESLSFMLPMEPAQRADILATLSKSTQAIAKKYFADPKNKARTKTGTYKGSLDPEKRGDIYKHFKEVAPLTRAEIVQNNILKSYNFKHRDAIAAGTKKRLPIPPRKFVNTDDTWRGIEPLDKAAFQAGANIANMPEVKAVTNKLLSEGQTVAQIVALLQNSQLAKQAKERTQEQAIIPDLTEKLAAQGVPNASKVAQTVAVKAVKKSQSSGIIPMALVGAALISGVL